MPDYVVQRLTVALNRRREPLNGARILLVGLSYKRNSSDARESPALVVAERLLAWGAEVRAADPFVVDDDVVAGVLRVELTPSEWERADAVVVLTDHDAFDLDGLSRGAKYVLDTRHRVPPRACVEYL
jgi:UDP-N-acetyl-D-glucosamine dehydrogenase